MIMAGRGRRLGDVGDSSKPVGASTKSTEETMYDLPTLITKINEIDVTDVNKSTLSIIQNSFKKLCTSKEVMKDILSDLHNKALIDSSFSEKLLVAFDEVFNFELDEVRVRNELLSFMQSDFDSKNVLSQTDRKKFLNAITLLGSGYRRMKICGKPISILGLALFEYFNLLLKGEEEDLKALTTQVLFNGERLSVEDKLVDKYKLLQQNLRNTLITKDLNQKSKCWILLSLDFISNNFKPLKEVVKEFYVSKLGEEYTKLESLIEVTSSQPNHTFSSPESIKSQGSDLVEKNKSFDSDNKKKDGSKKDLNERFSKMNVTPEDKRGKVQYGKNEGRENTKWQNDEKPNRTKGSSISGHDDRFEKDEDFYGVQMPRRPKPESQRKNLSNAKGKMKVESDCKSSKTDKSKEPENAQPSTEKSWD